MGFREILGNPLGPRRVSKYQRVLKILQGRFRVVSDGLNDVPWAFRSVARQFQRM